MQEKKCSSRERKKNRWTQQS